VYYDFISQLTTVVVLLHVYSMVRAILLTLVSVILLLKPQELEACTCFPAHTQTHFCGSDFGELNVGNQQHKKTRKIAITDI